MLHKTSSFKKKKNMRHEETGKNDLYTGGKAGDRNCENDQLFGLIDKDFKVAIIIIFRELKEAII